MDIKHRDFHIEMHLRHSFLQANLDTQYQKYALGTRLIEQADYWASSGHFQYALVCAFEGLGWIYLSSITQSATSLLATKRAECIIVKSAQEKFPDWRLSMEQQKLYKEVAEIFFQEESFESTLEILDKADIVPRWVTPVGYSS